MSWNNEIPVQQHVQNSRRKNCDFTHDNVFLKTELKDKQHMIISEESTLEEIMKPCEFHDKIHNGKVLTCFSKGAYGLKQSGSLANQQLRHNSAPCGRTLSKHIPSLRKNDATNTMLTLVVNDFRVKKFSNSNAEHLTQALKDKHEGVEANWEGIKLCGINLKLDCTKREY